MGYFGWQDVELAWFHPNEFRRPELMDRQLLKSIDVLRERCGFPLKVTSDARTKGDLIDIYGPETGWPAWLHERGSPHQRGQAVDLVPVAADKQEADERRMIVVHHAIGMWMEGLWPRLGLEYATRHVHVDNDKVLRRPHGWPGVSK